LRRPKSAISAAIVAMGLSAPVVLAQVMSRASGPTSDTNTSPASSSIDPALAGRPTRFLLRNGTDYLAYKEYGRALRFLRAAEARQGELDADELKALRQGIAQAQRGLREGDASRDLAGRSRTRRAGAMATARVEAATEPAPGPAPARGDGVRLAGASRAEEERPTPAVEPGPAPRRARPDGPAADTVADRAPAPIELPAPPRPLAEPSATPADLPAPAAAAGDAKPAATPVPAPEAARAPALDLPALPAEPTTPDETRPAATPEPRPTAPPTPALELPAPTPAGAEPRPDAPKVIGLEPLAEPAPAASGPAEPAANPPALPAQPADTKPAGLPELPPADATPAPRTPDATPASAPDQSPAPAPAQPSTANPAPLFPAPEPAPLPATEPSPVPAPAAEPAPRGATEVATPPVGDEPRPTVPPAPAASADEMPPLPGEERSAPAPRPSGVLDDPAHAPRPLTSDDHEEIGRVARRQADEARSRAASPSQATRPGLNVPTPMTGDAVLDPSASSNASTRFEITRAPSPTEAWPIRRIPVPEEFVPIPPRNFEPSRKYWAAPALCHMPLYFQDASLERYGHSVEQFFGPRGRYLTYPIDDPRQTKQRSQILQPAFSAGLFAFQIAALPYNLVVDPPWEAEYDLGYHRPGDRMPTDTFYLPLTGVGPILPPIKGRRY